MSRRTLDGAIATPDGKRRLRPRAFRDDRRSLRLHHARAVVRAGSPMEAAAGEHGVAAPGTSRARSGDRHRRHRGCVRGPRRSRGRPGSHATHDRAGARAEHGARVRFLVGDMLALPFPSASFDIVTTGYGLRNVPDLHAGSWRDSARAETWRRDPVARLQPPVEPYRARGVPGISRRGRRASWLRPPSRSRHVSIHSRRRSVVIQAPTPSRS